MFGGRIFATGMDEFGKFYLGNQVLDLSTGETTRIDLGEIISPGINSGGNVIPTYFENLGVGNLTVDFLLNFNGENINFNGFNTVLSAPRGLKIDTDEFIKVSLGGETVFTIDENNIPNVVIVSDTSPLARNDGSTLRNGDFWWDSSTGASFIYYVDGSSNQWVETGRAYIPT